MTSFHHNLMMAAGGEKKRPVYIHELSHTVLQNISVILDRNEKWKELGSDYLNLSLTDIFRLQKGNNPTYDMLWEWAQQNPTVTDLFKILSKMKQYYVMTFLKEYVSEHYHSLLLPKNESGNSEMRTLDTCPGPSKQPEESQSLAGYRRTLPKPPIPPPSSQGSRPQSSRTPTEETAYGPAFNALKSCCDDQISEGNDKVAQDLAQQLKSKLPIDSRNFNKMESEASLPSKMSAFRRQQNVHQSDVEILQPNVELQSNTNVNQEPESLVESIENNTQVAPSETVQNTHQSGKEESNLGNKDLDLSKLIGNVMLPSTPYKDIVLATDGFSEKRVLGRGGFGVVYEGNWRSTKVAIKRIEKKDNPGRTYFEEAKLQQSFVELKALSKYRHDNIVPLYGFSLKDGVLCLIYKFMVNGSLEDRLRRKNGTPVLSWEQRLVIACGSARGIQYLHNCDEKLIHGDIKSANILLGANLQPKIGDFGLAREGPMSQCTHKVVSVVHGTLPYLPLDYIKDRQLSTKVDTYSFGVVLFELATGLRAYNDSSPKHKLLRDYVVETDESKWDSLRDEKAGDEMKQVSEELIRIGKQCCHDRKKNRPEMVEVLEMLEHSQQVVEEKLKPVMKMDNFSSLGFSIPITDYSPQGTVSQNNFPNNESFQSNATDYGTDMVSSSSNNDTSYVPTPVLNIPKITELGTKEP